MQNLFFLFFSTFILLIMSATVTTAQKPVKPNSSPVVKYKKPLVKSSLGKVTGNTVLNADEARQVITLPLIVKDDKNINYLISSYQLAYKRIGVTEDEQTGKTAAQTDMVANRFTTTPLPPVWQKNIIEGLHKGEELYFFDIIVFDKQGRRFFAPELKIFIQ